MKEQIKNIIESYCEGINHLEFNIADLDKMADEILALQLQQTGVVGRSEQLVCGCGNPNLTWYGNDDDKTYFCFECKKVVTN